MKKQRPNSDDGHQTAITVANGKVLKLIIANCYRVVDDKSCHMLLKTVQSCAIDIITQPLRVASSVALWCRACVLRRSVSL